MTKLPQPLTKAERRDMIIDALFYVLPAPSRKEIMKRVSDHTGFTLTRSNLSYAINYLRKHYLKYGFTMNQAKRGSNRDLDDKFCIILVDPEGRPDRETHAETLLHVHQGAISTTRQVASLMTNAATTTRLMANQTRSFPARAKLNDLAADYEYVARKATAALFELENVA